MLRGVIYRLLQAIPVVVIFAVLVFMLLQLLPGDPAVAIAGNEATPAAIDRIRTQLGLDRPLLEQLLSWFNRLAHGDFGKSLILNQSVVSAVIERLPVTLSLSFLSLLVTLPAGISLGVLAAYWRNTWLDLFVMVTALLGVSMPSFWLGILSVILFSVTLGLAAAGRICSDLTRPVAVVQCADPACGRAGAVPDRFSRPHHPLGHARRARPGFHSHRARQRRRRVAHHHQARLPQYADPGCHRDRHHHQPPDRRLGCGRAGVCAAGIGRLIVQGILARDYPLVQGTMLIFGFSFVLINILVDIIYMLVDPRVRFG